MYQNIQLIRIKVCRIQIIASTSAALVQQLVGFSCIDYEKSFDSVDRECLWKPLGHYGIPEKIISIIRNSYEGLTYSVMHIVQLIDFCRSTTR